MTFLKHAAERTAAFFRVPSMTDKNKPTRMPAAEQAAEMRDVLRSIRLDQEEARLPSDPKCFNDCPYCWRHRIGTGEREKQPKINDPGTVHFRCSRCRDTWSMPADREQQFCTPEEVRAFLSMRKSTARG